MTKTGVEEISTKEPPTTTRAKILPSPDTRIELARELIATAQDFLRKAVILLSDFATEDKKNGNL